MLTEKQFLMGLALRKFNFQYGRTLQVADCDMKSIPTRYGSDRSYQIFSLRTDDFVSIHIHIKFEDRDKIGDYRVELDSVRSQISESSSSLIDEVFVAMCTIDPYYINNGVYKFRPMSVDATLLQVFLTENNEDFIYENGEQMLLETAY